MSSELDKAIDGAAKEVGGVNYLNSFGNDANFVPSGSSTSKGDPKLRNTDTPDNENDKAREEIRRKVDQLAKEYHLTEKEKIAYVNAIGMDAFDKKQDMFRMGPATLHEEKDYLAYLKEYPTPASRAAAAKEADRTLGALLKDTSSFSNPDGLTITPNPDPHGGNGGDTHAREGQAAAARGDERSRTIEAELRKEGLYDAQGRFLKGGQEDGILGGGATKALERFEQVHGLHGDASDAAAIDALAASGKIDQKFAEALKQISGDGTLAKLETKFGSPVHVPEEHLASSRDKIQKPAAEQGHSPIPT